ncbi:hypothetical protein HYPSUDRAFT_1047744 [Hypholoma sublateritium FD-334 SS-4]|uniref:Uncharacterized protein n=1 Tax=Hypholoma sublateritium (strain FD-334 SS-4) TaxID=945553 RepID=A0A0D2KQN5_HYPSF|nr:hypothetical protein HYPSUDRAFT_1047744 [Hypholoma sublateritium FD-334 SS-4]
MPSASQDSPAIWLALLLVGPASATLLLQLYAWISARMVLRIEGALMAAVMCAGMKMHAGSAGVDSETDSNGTPRSSVASLLTTDVTNIPEARDWLLLFACVR